jgi:hypothetical protein
MIRLASDPEPVAVCTECGVGLDSWLTTELVELRPGRRGFDRRSGWHSDRPGDRPGDRLSDRRGHGAA